MALAKARDHHYESIPRRHFLVTVGYLSNIWEVDELCSTTSDAVIRKLKAHFGRYGIPLTVFTDNASQQFAHFANEWDFKHHTSSPHYPQSNGMVESAVKTAKELLTKALESEREPQLAFLDYRNTPQQGTQMSPTQAFLNAEREPHNLQRRSSCSRDMGHHKQQSKHNKGEVPLTTTRARNSSVRYSRTDCTSTARASKHKLAE
ncbi:uncharacterized protein LOC135389594 [Ornithodoros turicata]|uniref:uncharacterized protein LOC135389594 n=1 Tax=Ornithodoros turicata TaxID=34597 RepID=UPI003139ACF0